MDASGRKGGGSEGLQRKYTREEVKRSTRYIAKLKNSKAAGGETKW